MQWWKDFFNGVGFVMAVIVFVFIFFAIPVYLIAIGSPLWGIIAAFVITMVFVGFMNAQDQKEKRERQQKEK
jgi:NhaP-type Na+/H+ or K+/H+ antiporter